MNAVAERSVVAAGVRLRVRVEGTAHGGTPVLVLHGFTGCAESMQDVVDALSATRRVVAPDLVGHGGSESPEDPSRYEMEACVEQLIGVMDRLDLGRAHVVGYSMGGRVALSLCVAHPDRVASLLLVGASPGLARPEEREARVAADDGLASEILGDGLEGFVDRWMALPLFATQASLPAEVLQRQRAQRLQSDPAGLAGSLRGMGTGAMPALHEHLKEIAQPLCLVAGALDVKFARLAREMAARIPRARVALIDGVGHAAHLEDPDRFAEVARAFLDDLESKGDPR